MPRIRPLISRAKAGLWVALLLLSAHGTRLLAAGPASELYLNAGQNGFVFVVQGQNIVRSWQPGWSGLSAIAVRNTVELTAGASGMPGQEFTLDGQFMPPTYTFPDVPGTAIYDGASDGAHIYGWDYNQNRLLRFDSHWMNPVPIFSLGGGQIGDFLGVTFDPTDSSFWISGFNLSEVRHLSSNGVLLGSFSTGHLRNAALALDPVTQTLWLANNQTFGWFEQYSKTGQLLNAVYYPELSTMNVLGAEFRVPEPSSASLIVLAILVTWSVQARFRARAAPGGGGALVPGR